MLIAFILHFFFTAYNQYDLEMEMSCDTYPYGVDASPMVKTVNGKNPRIDSINNDGVVGNIGGKKYRWDRKGKCEGENDSLNLTWSDLFFNYPAKDN